MCESCGCVASKARGTPAKVGLCIFCGEKLSRCTCEELTEELDYKDDEEELEDEDEEDEEEDEEEEEDEDYDEEEEEDEDEDEGEDDENW